VPKLSAIVAALLWFIAVFYFEMGQNWDNFLIGNKKGLG